MSQNSVPGPAQIQGEETTQGREYWVVWFIGGGGIFGN